MFSLALILSLLARLSADGCVERPVLNLQDCGGLSLKTVDQLLTTERDWVTAINFRHNRFVIVNVSKLLEKFPNLQHLDLRENLALDCRTIWDFGIHVESDCKFDLFMPFGNILRRLAFVAVYTF